MGAELPHPRNIRLVIEYDGTGYSGWQRQAGDPSIQEALETALAELLREKISVTGAGRTDAGVHARGQVANFRSGTQMECGQIARGLNALLRDDIAVLHCDDVAESFHARFDAVGRRYAYTISTVPTALDRGRVWYLRYSLDAGPMRDAAAAIVGRHDFSSFCRAGADVRHHFCEVREAAWTEEGGRIVFSITADRFLHGMVRALVGTMVDVGRGFISVTDFQAVLAGRNRTLAGPAAPPAGLTLEEVYY
jgi:tRNA pseudouridine38-40 synthase